MDPFGYFCKLSGDPVSVFLCERSSAVAIFFGALIALIFLNFLLKILGRGRTLGKRKRVVEVAEEPEKELGIVELALRIEKERDLFRAVFSSMEEGFLVVDKELKIILMNQKASILLRTAPKEAVGRKVEEIFYFFPAGEKNAFTLSEEVRALRRIVEETDTLNIKMENNYFCKNKKGENFPVALTAAPFLRNNKEKEGAIIIFKDITAEKEIDKAKSEFVSLASHQLQTPLVSAKWYVEALLNKDLGGLTEKQGEYLQEVYESNQRMIELVNSLLNVSRVELGVLAIRPEPVDLKKILAGVLKELRGQLEDRGIEVSENYDESTTAINADPIIMRAVFQNLISNAVKYSFEGGKIRIEIKRKDAEVLIEVEDGGCGIPKEQQPRMFTKLFRAHNALQKAPEGNGLGLYVAKRLLEEAGGKIWFFSEGDGKGSLFSVSLPPEGMKAKSGTKKLSGML